MSLLYDKVINIINKPPVERQDGEIEQILPWFRKKSDLFKSLHTDIVRDIVKNCKFTPTKRDSVIIRQMDKGDCFYIILSGSVAIHINTTLTEEEYPAIKETQLIEEALVEREAALGRALDRTKYGIYVGKIDAGKSFGELALINADCVRNATIIADESTDLLSVDRDLYNRSLRAFQTHEFEQRKDFVSSFPMFHSWAPRYKKMMAMSLKKQVLRFEDTIVKQGNAVDGIHFIIRGQVKIRVDPQQHPSQYQHLYPLGDIADLEREKARELLRKEMNLERQRTVDKKSTYQRRAVPVSDVKKTNQKPLELCLAGAIDVIGDLEMAMGLMTYSQTVECTEESVIFHLDQRNYDRLIEKRNPGALEMLRDIVHTKLTLHFSRLNEETIPLYRYFLYTLDEKEKDARLNARTPRSRTPQDMDVNVENLQKGPLVNMYGPGSVFYLIRKRAKEMKARQKRHMNNPASNFRFGGVAAKPSVMAAVKTLATLTSNVYGSRNVNTQNEEPTSATASMINLYGAADPKMITELDDADYADGDGYETNYLDLDEQYDWASSDTALSKLEERLTRWHNSLPTIQKGNCVVPLHRFQFEDEHKPKPGNKVYVKLKSKPKHVSIYALQNTTRTEDLTGSHDRQNGQNTRSVLTRSAEHISGFTAS
ncbi:uncharacterized protein LOC131952283 isoform X2 [Physella acuta]|uniref:uncharacterized protein LOC131952283 isoform X2 n=1 Tax=Physella acuta TaxID=109671 RepID=UPI0027DDB5DB|nr:uncharacterized protein LOC131952283 isoform X2 [Physella acuta]